jgi:uncharacterized protein
MHETIPDPTPLLERHFRHSSRALAIVAGHSRLVADKALAIAARAASHGIAVDLAFVEAAAMLHDIGVCRVSAPGIGCHGPLPYIAHGIAGREILEAEGLPHLALVCERHIGVGLTAEDIRLPGLPLPCRQMVPLSAEERIVCLADLFYSKAADGSHRQKALAEVEASLARFGEAKVITFRRWWAEFGCDGGPL